MSFPLTDPNILGLAYDGMGIMIFGVPALLLSSAAIAQEDSGGTFDYNRYTIRLRIEQKWDTCVGSSFLAAGFAFQITAALGYRFVPPTALALWIALPTLALVYLLLRRRLIEQHTDRIVAIVIQRLK